MRTITTLAVTAGTALVLVPATFAANGNGNANGKPQAGVTGTSGASGTTGTTGTTGATGPKAAKAPKGNAYGFYCKSASKKHVKGQKGTPFSQCVKALKAMDSGKAAASTPAKACKAVPKKKAPGAKKTSYSICVSAAAKLQAAS